MINKKPNISVVIAAYNVENEAYRAIQSILNQKYQNFEIIFVDDGSEDRTLEIIQSIDDERLKILSNNHTGVSVAKNTGVAAASGNFLMFLDADDYFLTDDAFEILAEQMSTNDYDWLSFDYLIIGQHKRKKRATGNSVENMYAAVWNKIYRRELFDGIFFPIGKKYDDVIISVELWEAAKHRGYLPRTLYGYWQRQDSVVRKVENYKKHLDLLDVVEQAVNEHKIDLTNIAVKRYLNKHIFNHLVVALYEADVLGQRLTTVELSRFRVLHKQVGINQFSAQQLVNKMYIRVFNILLKGNSHKDAVLIATVIQKARLVIRR